MSVFYFKCLCELFGLVNKKVAGVVIAWSPESSVKAKNVGNKMAVPPKKKSATAPKPQKGGYPSGANQSGSYSSSGSAADMDSF